MNQGFDSVFKPGQMTLGVVAPIESYTAGPVPLMTRHIERARLVESLGFKALWLRDVPFNDPTFGDAGQIFDPFVYLGLLAGLTDRIALGVSSIILPLRHPAHVAKAAATVDQLSGGRLLLGIASGDRPAEFPAFNVSHAERGASFRASYEYIRQMSDDFPVFDSELGSSGGMIDLLPKPVANRIPMFITGGSQQTPHWVAQHGDGWMTYPRAVAAQQQVINQWRDNIEAAGVHDKPVIQPLHIDLATDPFEPPRPIHLGYRLGINPLREYLSELRDIGMNHVVFNLRFNQADTEETLVMLAEELLGEFSF